MLKRYGTMELERIKTIQAWCREGGYGYSWGPENRAWQEEVKRIQGTPEERELRRKKTEKLAERLRKLGLPY